MRNTIIELRYRSAIHFGVAGDVRFISHHDMMRLFQRAMARADLPVRFSQGFNPRPKLSLPLPKPVGMASLAELLVTEWSQDIEPTAVLERLSSQMPTGMTPRACRRLQDNRTIHPECAWYALDLPPELRFGLDSRIGELMACKTWLVQRSRDGQSAVRSFDLRAGLLEMELTAGSLIWAIRVDPAGTLRTGELLTALSLPTESLLHRVQRMRVQWSDGWTTGEQQRAEALP